MILMRFADNYHYIIRAKRLKRLAERFNLKYDIGDKTKITVFYTPTYKKNIVTGIVNAHKIELYDTILPSIGIGGVPGGKGNTTFKIDDEFVDGSGLAILMSVGKIEKKLSTL